MSQLNPPGFLYRNALIYMGWLLSKTDYTSKGTNLYVTTPGTVAKLAMRQPFVLFKGLTFQKLCLPGAFRPGDHHNK
ncbi:TPA: hypothetical protein ACQFMS_005305, partial [Escherichia coli]